ncbi:MAG: outer membrane protein transport protein [Deltaproteobacteria bacterium]|nr:outer membrane protein transport protein [Deltaproteobacteria bacterium]
MRAAFLAPALLLLSVAPARGAGFAVAEHGAVAAGTASAGTAREGDPAAGWYNPAAIADGAGWRVGLGILAAIPALRASSSDSKWEASTEERIATPPHFQASYAKGAHAVGLALSIPYGGGVSWPANWQGRFEIVSSQLEFARVAPYYAWRHGRLRLAAGFHIDAGRMKIHRRLDFIDTEGDVSLNLAGAGLGFDLAAFVNATPQLDLGLSFKSRTRLALSGNADFTVPDAFLGKAADQHARVEMTLPDRLAIGAHWHEGPWALLLDVDITWWSVHKKLVIDFANEEPDDAIQENNWKTTAALRGGAEWFPAENWVLRTGVYLDPSPARDDSLAPSSPDSTRVGGTVGLGYALGRSWAMDAFYEYMWILSREAKNEEALAARYSGHAQLFGLGLRYSY